MEKTITVIIADDNAIMRKTLCMMIADTDGLQLAGEASNGDEAIALAKECCPDIILMDINMSPVNGFEATRKIIKQNPGAKIIALSLHKASSYARNMLNLGARGYVTKSASHLEIIEAIFTVSEGKKYIAKDMQDLL
jgi:DNA-binding NarL/FixJ family response regulator